MPLFLKTSLPQFPWVFKGIPFRFKGRGQRAERRMAERQKAERHRVERERAERQRAERRRT